MENVLVRLQRAISHLIRFRNLVPDISNITCKYLRLIVLTYKSKNKAIFFKARVSRIWKGGGHEGCYAMSLWRHKKENSITD